MRRRLPPDHPKTINPAVARRQPERRAVMALALRAGGMGTWELEIATGRIRWDARQRQLFGLAPDEEVTLEQAWRRIHPDDVAFLQALQAEAIRAEVEFRAEFRVVHPGGGVRWLAAQGRTYRDRAGRPARMIGVNYDITDRKTAEEALRASEERFRGTFENAAVGIAHVALDGRLLRVNDRLCEITGYSREELLRKSLHDLGDPGDPAGTLALRERMKRVEEHSFRLEKSYRHRDGFIAWVYLTAALQRNARGEPEFWILMVECITARKAAEQALLASEERLKQALQAAEDASRAKSQFLANISHEIRTPMTVIVSSLELLRQAAAPAPPAARQPYLQMAEAAAERLLALIDDLLDLSRIEARRLEVRAEPFSLRRCLDRAAAFFHRQAQEKGITLRVETAPEVPDRVLGDRDRLGQVLTNLIGNAIKFTDRGEVAVAAGVRGDSLEFSVRDTGIGIPADRMDRLFRSFSQVDSSHTRRYGGTGLGLAVSKGLVELMGGNIRAESAPGKGSVFSFEIPLRLPADEATAMAAAETSAAGRGEARILLAEDDAMVRDLIRMILQQKAWEVRTVENGREAVAAWQGERFDLILMDLQMPEMDGFEATRLIRSREGAEEHVPIVALTAHARRQDREECLAAGMDGWLPKPVDMERLFAAVEENLGRN
jgi:PAS domain S-box-containing protein